MHDSILLPLVVGVLTLWLAMCLYEIGFKIWRYFQRNPKAGITVMAGVYFALMAAPSIWIATIMGGAS